MQKPFKWLMVLIIACTCLSLTGCSSIPDEAALLDATAKGDRYIVTIVDYDRTNRIVSLYREFRGAKSVQRSDVDFQLHARQRRDGRIVGGAHVDLSELHPARERQKAEFLRYDMEYYHYDGTRWIPIVSPERFLKTQKKN